MLFRSRAAVTVADQKTRATASSVEADPMAHVATVASNGKEALDVKAATNHAVISRKEINHRTIPQKVNKEIFKISDLIHRNYSKIVEKNYGSR